jgi:oligopeptide/dipeptide ABC transporter ATP-binding protein
MYLGNVVEYSDVDTIFNHSQHPYTEALLRSIPSLEAVHERLTPIESMVPSPFNRPKGCPFHPRCEYRVEGICDASAPEPIAIAPNHTTRCFMHDPRTQANFAAKEVTHGYCACAGCPSRNAARHQPNPDGCAPSEHVVSAPQRLVRAQYLVCESRR